MTTLVTLWWLFFWSAIGLCVGSFLNVVVHRLPRNRSISRPTWSACPRCHRRIRWYDNIPVISFVVLRGRCRDCGIPISTRYVVLELAMAIVVLMLVDAFFVGQVREGLSHSLVGLTERLVLDWPILVSHIFLFACLLSMSVIDLEHYWVDVRFTNVATLAGFVLHALWTPSTSAAWTRPGDTLAVVSMCVVVGLGLVWVVMACQPHVDPEDYDEPSPELEEESEVPQADGVHKPPPSLHTPPRTAGWIAALLFVALAVGLFLENTGHLSVELRHSPRALLPLLFFFVLIVCESAVPRDSDQQIVDAIEEERHGARRMVLTELTYLLPAVALGLVGLWAMWGSDEISTRAGAALDYFFHIDGISLFRTWSPLQGIATAAAGYVVGGGLGWIIRIGFTLLFGKEAFGSGDIHLMAAAGCVAGWPVVVLGFFLACGLAMAGWIATLPFKRARAIPLGPWLSLAFLITVVFYNHIIEDVPLVSRAIQAFEMFRQNM